MCFQDISSTRNFHNITSTPNYITIAGLLNESIVINNYSLCRVISLYAFVLNNRHGGMTVEAARQKIGTTGELRCIHIDI